MSPPFGDKHGPEDRKHRPPPNYSSRRVQVRLLLLVSTAMLVLMMIFKVRDPGFWWWMGFDNQPAGEAPLSEAEQGGEAVDTRISTTANVRTNDLPGTIKFPSRDVPALELDPQQQRKLDAFQQSRLDRWSRVLADLSAEQHVTFKKVLKAARDVTDLPEKDRSSWPTVLQQIDQSFNQYGLEARSAIEQTTEQERAFWSTILDRLDSDWQNQLKPALAAAGEASEVDADPYQALLELQHVLDQLALQAVEDNTVFRPAESDAWFRLLDVLRNADPRQLEAAATERVGFLQLYKQPEDYRGKLVTLRGVARQGYHVQAPQNIFGITGYYVLWLKPSGGPNSPVVVYALEMPAGFPHLKDKDRDRETTSLDEDVEVTGYFFKNWAYRAQDATRVAPLLLAKSPRWQPSIFAQEQNDLPSLPWIALVVLVIAAVATGVSLIVYRQTRMTPPAVHQRGAASSGKPEKLAALKNETVAPNVDESLRRLSAAVSHADRPNRDEPRQDEESREKD